MSAPRLEMKTYFTAGTPLYLLFFISGISALIYQIVWQRALFTLFGSDPVSVTIVVTAFILGLGCGSLGGGWLSCQRFVRPLVAFALLEIGIGLFGLLSLALFQTAAILVQSPSLLGAVALAVGLLFIPTFLMGATLPLLAAYMVRQSENVGRSTGQLYRVNTLGAAMGCAACIGLFPWIGMHAVIWLAAALNLTTAVCALALFFRRGGGAPAGEPWTAMPAAPGRRLWLPAAIALAFASGFISLSYEIFLFRLASFASGTSSLIFAAFLAAFLIGIAAGAAQVAAVCERPGLGDTAFPAFVIRNLFLASLLGLLVLPLISISGPLGYGMISLILLAGFVLAKALSAVFPIVVHFAVLPDRHTGRWVSVLYMANIAGSALGSLLTGFVLVDMIDMNGIAVLLAGLLFALAAGLCLANGRWPQALRRYALATLAAGAALVLFARPDVNSVVQAMLYKAAAKSYPPVTAVVETRAGIIAVSSDGTVFGGGMYDGRFNIDPVRDTNGIIRPYGLSLYHPAPRGVLMIGLSSGSWAQVVANNPDVRQLTIVEINPGYLGLVGREAAVASVLTNPKVRIVIDDGRRWLRLHPDLRFDAILANTTFNFRSNASNLLSLEFNEVIRSHLNPGGVYLYNATDSLRAERTGCLSFRYGYRVFNNLLASDAPIAFDAGRWRGVLVDYRIDGRPVLQLDRPADRDALDRMLELPAELPHAGPAAGLEDCASILQRTAALRPITDDNMGTEWRYPLGLED